MRIYRAALIITGRKAYLWGMIKGACMSYYLSTDTRFSGKGRSKAAANMLVDTTGFHKEKGVSSAVLNPAEGADRYILPEKIAEIKNRTGCTCKVAVKTGKRYI